MVDTAVSSSARYLSSTFNSAHASTARFAFLVHSQDTLPNNLPPSVDDKPLARQKRRRTSPEDQAILEAEYLKNPKPDKALRMEIVSRVALGEKEVQIWFQNRRQNTRRKSRPLLPHEVVPSLLSSSFGEHSSYSNMSSQSGLEESSSSFCSSQEITITSNTDPGESKDDKHVSGEAFSKHLTDIASAAGLDPAEIAWRACHNATSQQKTIDITSSQSNDKPASYSVLVKDGISLKAGPELQSVGYISNRRNILGGTQSTAHTAVSIGHPDVTHHVRGQGLNPQPPLLKRTSSLVRMSLSLDGKAEIVISDDESPPSSQSAKWVLPAVRIGGLRRSKSAIDSLGTSKEIQRRERFSLTGATVGRSRDSKTWAFYCDSDARAAILADDKTGSAAEAIELLRSRPKSVLQSSALKRNAQVGLQETCKRRKIATGSVQKPKLARTTSSSAVLQSISGNRRKMPKTVAADKPDKPKDDLETFGYEDLGDSDKENWVPGLFIRRRRERLPRSRSIRQALSEHVSDPTQQDIRTTTENQYAGLGSSLERQKKDIRVVAREEFLKKINGDKENAPICSKDRESRSGSDTPREEEDLDCVQNLLSLSQGLWR